MALGTFRQFNCPESFLTQNSWVLPT